MTTIAARRVRLPGSELAGMCARLGLELPPAFRSTAPAVREVHPSIAAGLRATCAPLMAVLVSTSWSEAALGVRDDLGGSLVRGGPAEVEVSAWPAMRLGEELARAVPVLPSRSRADQHLPLDDVPDLLRTITTGFLRATVVAPPQVVGLVVWVATTEGWLALEPAEVRAGGRWTTVRPVVPADLGAAVAPYVATALA